MKKRIFYKLLISVLVFAICAGPALLARPKGHIEFGFHYSKWSIDLFRSLIETGINDAVESELKKVFLEDIQKKYPRLIEESYSQKLAFDSSGDNFGFEIRYYPGGEEGSFSLGMSLEKTSMKVSIPDVSVTLKLEDSITKQKADFQGTARSEFSLKPLSLHVSFRWDLIPSSKIHPYITFGMGVATSSALEEAPLIYSYEGDLVIAGQKAEHHEDSADKTLKELKDEVEAEGKGFFLPNFLPFVQLNLGLKGVITENLHLLVDAGIWNGFALRGGIAFRF